MYKKHLKRFIDIFISLSCLIVLSPLFLLIGIMIKLDSKGKVVFKQKRVGLHKKYFYMYKFRTMKGGTPTNIPTDLLENPESWITRVGKILRKTSLDELPQMWNILKGDMSVVGPRPVIVKEYELIEEREKYGANDILPGLTGWAQVNGRDKLTKSQKAKYDGEYVEKISFLFDLKCCLLTIKKIISAEGVIEGKITEWDKEE